MSRVIAGKIYVSGELEAKTPISVGGAGGGIEADLTLAVDGEGRFYVPGSSLMGPLRHWVMRHFGEEFADEMMGFQRSSQGHASFLWVEDAPLILPNGLGSEIRSSVQIDRVTGTSRSRFLFDRMVLPRGTRLPLRLTLDLSSDKSVAEKCEAVLAHMLDHLTHEGLRVGAAKGRGLGLVKVADHTTLEVRRYTLDKKGIFVFLRDAAARRSGRGFAVSPENFQQWVDESKEKQSRARHDHLVFEVSWRPLSPLMVKSPFDGAKTDSVPLVSGTGDGRVAPVLTGAGLKGVFRAHAARILRTLLREAAKPCGGPNDPNPDGEIPILLDLFGSTERVGRLGVSDVYQRLTFENDGSQGIPAEDWWAEGTLTESVTDCSTHVAIDRFTGGAAEKRLFTMRTPQTRFEWDPIVIEVDFNPMLVFPYDSQPLQIEEMRRAELALLLLVLRDFEAGMVPIGFGSRRGLGSIQVTHLKVRGLFDGKTWNYDVSSVSELLNKIQDLEDIQEAWTAGISRKFWAKGNVEEGDGQ